MESPPPEKIAICLGKHDTEEQTNTEQGIDSWAPFKSLQIRAQDGATKRVVGRPPETPFLNSRLRSPGIDS
jgi:hypothetical protein